MKKGKILMTLAIVFFLTEVFNLLFIKNEYAKMFINDIGLVLLSFMVVAIWLLAYNLIDKRFGGERKVWIFLGIAFALRFLGELIWAFYEIFLKIEIPNLSIADIAWTLSYIFVLISFRYKMKYTYIENKKSVVYLMLAICTALAGVYLYLDFLNIVRNPAVINISENILNQSYVVFDIYIIGLILAINLPLIRGYNKVMKSCFVMAFAFISFGIFDYLYTVGVREGTYISGSFIDLFYYWAYLLAAYSVFLRYKLMNTITLSVPKENYHQDVKKPSKRRRK